MKSSRLFKILVVTFALQNLQLQAIPIFKQNAEVGQESYEGIQGLLAVTTDAGARKPIIIRLFKYIDEDVKIYPTKMAAVAHMFDLVALGKEISDSSSLAVATSSSTALVNKYNGGKGSSKLSSLLRSRKAQVATVATVVAAALAWKNKEALKNNAVKAFDKFQGTKIYKDGGNLINKLGETRAGKSLSNFRSSARSYAGRAFAYGAGLGTSAWAYGKGLLSKQQPAQAPAPVQAPAEQVASSSVASAPAAEQTVPAPVQVIAPEPIAPAPQAAAPVETAPASSAVVDAAGKLAEEAKQFAEKAKEAAAEQKVA